MLSEKDLKQIAQKGISQEQIENQLNEFKTGFPFLKLEAAASISRGIIALTHKHASSMRRHGNSTRPQANAW